MASEARDGPPPAKPCQASGCCEAADGQQGCGGRQQGQHATHASPPATGAALQLPSPPAGAAAATAEAAEAVVAAARRQAGGGGDAGGGPPQPAWHTDECVELRPACWPGRYRSPLRRVGLHLKVRDAEPEQLPTSFRSALAAAAAAAGLWLHAAAARRGCLELSLVLEGLALPLPTAWQRGGAPPGPEPAAGRTGGQHATLPTAAVLAALGLSPAPMHAQAQGQGTRMRPTALAPGLPRVMREPDQLLTPGYTPSAPGGGATGAGSGRGGASAASAFGAVDDAASGDAAHLPPLPAHVAPRVLLLRPAPAGAAAGPSGDALRLKGSSDGWSGSQWGLFGLGAAGPLRLSLRLGAELAAEVLGEPQRSSAVPPPPPVGAFNAATSDEEEEKFESADSAWVEAGAQVGPAASPVVARVAALEVLALAPGGPLPLRAELVALPHAAAAFHSGGADDCGSDGEDEQQAGGAAACAAAAFAVGAHPGGPYVELSLELLEPPPRPGLVLLELYLRPTGASTTPAAPPPPRRASLPLLALGPEDAALAAELSAVVASFPPDSYDDLDELLYDIGTWISITSAVKPPRGPAAVGSSSSQLTFPLQDDDANAQLLVVEDRVNLEAEMWPAVGPPLLLHAEAAGWDALAERLRVDLRAAPPAAVRALQGAGWGLLARAEGGATAADAGAAAHLAGALGLGASAAAAGGTGGGVGGPLRPLDGTAVRGTALSGGGGPASAQDLSRVGRGLDPVPAGAAGGGALRQRLGAAAVPGAGGGERGTTQADERGEQKRAAEAAAAMAAEAAVEELRVSLSAWGQLAEAAVLVPALALAAAATLRSDGRAPPSLAAPVVTAAVAACAGGTLLTLARPFLPWRRWLRLVSRARLSRYGAHVAARGLAALSVAAAAAVQQQQIGDAGVGSADGGVGDGGGGSTGRVSLLPLLAALALWDGLLLPLACMLPPRPAAALGGLRLLLNATLLAALAQPSPGTAGALLVSAAVEAAALATGAAARAALHRHASTAAAAEARAGQEHPLGILEQAQAQASRQPESGRRARERADNDWDAAPALAEWARGNDPGGGASTSARSPRDKND
ncbi:hypothetical protein HYH03_004322 [Edaphochlamys debaryana]|uniref:Uncharacterized protein n=1 Tax=Edaphochlamys debaryana TaxID=47281 RepID=A0A836C230_9CHLO|nr:hypothetical protein HYH03_004322 [Edaphochlamys debaryana]|eukprot:KAG2497576.1 hypothetical protein HYH03_004322 [Edaphochlamys debaryana]